MPLLLGRKKKHLSPSGEELGTDTDSLLLRECRNKTLLLLRGE
jgi:hypothetical protein